MLHYKYKQVTTNIFIIIILIWLFIIISIFNIIIQYFIRNI